MSKSTKSLINSQRLSFMPFSSLVLVQLSFKLKKLFFFFFAWKIISPACCQNSYNSLKFWLHANKGCVPFSQSKSGFCNQKYDVLFQWGQANQSKTAIQTIFLRTWIVQIGISIWFQMFVPFSRKSLDSDHEKIQSIWSTLMASDHRQNSFFATLKVSFLISNYHYNMSTF